MRAHELKLSHFSALPIEEVQACDPGWTHWKPQGLWVSLDDKEDWISCCERLRLPLGKTYAHRYRVRLRRDCQVLLLEDYEDLETFSELYPAFNPYDNSRFWREVAREFDGIIVSDAFYMPRGTPLSLDWFHAWDCASGCIWNPRAIEGFEDIRLDS